jgi:azurin
MKLVALLFASSLITGTAFAKTCDIKVEGSDAMSFNTKTMALAGCTDVKLTLKHTGKLPKAAMGHNIVVSAESEMKNVIADATKAVIVATKLIGGGESTEVTFSTSKLKKGTKYKFYCTFPGHSTIMQGDVTL